MTVRFARSHSCAAASVSTTLLPRRRDQRDHRLRIQLLLRLHRPEYLLPTRGADRNPVISLGGENYNVQHILYDIYTIILADSDVFVVGSCPAVSHNVSFDELWLYNSSTFHNLTFFFGCDTGLLEFEADKIKCPGFKGPPGAGDGESFVLITDENDRYPELELARNCSMIATVPVRGDILITAGIQSSFTWGGYGDVLKRGFELEWSRITEDGCHLCEESNGQFGLVRLVATSAFLSHHLSTSHQSLAS
jgi:hypothetical protein